MVFRLLSCCAALAAFLFSNSAMAASIVNGNLVASSDPEARSTVALTQWNGTVICSGVLLGEDVLLTAAHCLVNLRMVWAPQVIFDVATFSPQGAPKPAARKLTRVVFHSKFSPDAMGDDPTRTPHDIGLAFFKAPLPANKVPAKIGVVQPSSLPVKVILAGYGVTQTTATQADGFLRAVESGVSRLFTDAQVVQIGPHARGGACFGDSGGPVFLPTEPRAVVGLISYGPEESGLPDCEQGRSYATDLKFYEEWISKNAGIDLVTGERRTPEPFESSGFAL